MWVLIVAARKSFSVAADEEQQLVVGKVYTDTQGARSSDIQHFKSHSMMLVGFFMTCWVGGSPDVVGARAELLEKPALAAVY